MNMRGLKNFLSISTGHHRAEGISVAALKSCSGDHATRKIMDNRLIHSLGSFSLAVINIQHTRHRTSNTIGVIIILITFILGVIIIVIIIIGIVIFICLTIILVIAISTTFTSYHHYNVPCR